MYDLPDNAIIYADSARGVYIPQFFAESIRRECVLGMTQDAFDVLLSGPDHENYWDAWDDFLIYCQVESNGVTYNLWQDGDLWLVPADWQPSEDSF